MNPVKFKLRAKSGAIRQAARNLLQKGIEPALSFIDDRFDLEFKMDQARYKARYLARDASDLALPYVKSVECMLHGSRLVFEEAAFGRGNGSLGILLKNTSMSLHSALIFGSVVSTIGRDLADGFLHTHSNDVTLALSHMKEDIAGIAKTLPVFLLGYKRYDAIAQRLRSR